MDISTLVLIAVFALLVFLMLRGGGGGCCGPSRTKIRGKTGAGQAQDKEGGKKDNGHCG